MQVVPSGVTEVSGALRKNRDEAAIYGRQEHPFKWCRACQTQCEDVKMTIFLFLLSFEESWVIKLELKNFKSF